MATTRATLLTATLQGIDAVPVRVEACISDGLPNFLIVGMPDAAIQEARVRVVAAIKSSGYKMPGGRVVINLAPSSLKKTGSGFDLPIALSILAATMQINKEKLKSTLLVGELSLEGEIKPIKGMLAHEFCAKENGWNLLCPQPADGLLSLEGLTLRTVRHLNDFEKCEFYPARCGGHITHTEEKDYSDISSNDFEKRALQIAATGNHGVLMMGPPGSGKTMLASRIPTILPPLTEEEMLESALLHSIAGETMDDVFNQVRPFRNPHHSATIAGLIGGGNPAKPGEISLAHNGVLFLDELAEFKTSTLQAIRQPLESGMVNLIRADQKLRFPARFMLVAATNPCPCGFYGDPQKPCACTEGKVQAYQNRIGGPLLDRISIHLRVWRSEPGEVLKSGNGQSSHRLKEGVLTGREFRSYRMSKQDIGKTNSLSLLMHACSLQTQDQDYLEEMAKLYHMSGRALMSVLSVARTIADLTESMNVEREHLCEALELRVRSRNEK